MKEVFGNPCAPALVTSEPAVWTTSSMLFGEVTTDALGGVGMVDSPMRYAMDYIKDTREKRERLIFHFCVCNYCRSTYPANLDLGYECPACGAYDFEIRDSIKESI